MHRQLNCGKESTRYDGILLTSAGPAKRLNISSSEVWDCRSSVAQASHKVGFGF
jgi:hypothetical protein